MLTIVNLCARPVSIRLNTGATRHLTPHGKIVGLRPAEVANNPMVEKLAGKRLIKVLSKDIEVVSEENDSERAPTCSKDLSAAEAISHIESAPLSSLEEFTAGEQRKTVLEALERLTGEGAR